MNLLERKCRNLGVSRNTVFAAMGFCGPFYLWNCPVCGKQKTYHSRYSEPHPEELREIVDDPACSHCTYQRAPDVDGLPLFDGEVSG